jgi:hypothetical protein
VTGERDPSGAQPSRRCAAPGALLPLRLDLERAIDGRDDLVGDRFAIEDLPVLPRMAMYPLVQLSLDPSGTRTWRRWLAAVERPKLVLGLAGGRIRNREWLVGTPHWAKPIVVAALKAERSAES